MKHGKVLISSLLCVAALLTTYCAPQHTGGTPHGSAAGIPDRRTTEEEKIVLFSEGGSWDFYASDGYSNRGVFDCIWRANSAKIQDGVMKMSVSEEQSGYAGAEYRSKSSFGYGFYSVSMKAAKCSGVISSFFTYTNRGGWDEIDIEFLGKDTTGIQLNYYSKGEGGHEFWYPLGFDGADDFHEYAFEWLETSITWYVDGKAIYRVTENIPTNATQIMMNVWNCKGADAWSGTLNKNALPATAEYEWIGFSAAN